MANVRQCGQMRLILHIRDALQISPAVALAKHRIYPLDFGENRLLVTPELSRKLKNSQRFCPSLRFRQQVAFSLMYLTAGEAISKFTNCRDFTTLAIRLTIKCSVKKKKENIRYRLPEKIAAEIAVAPVAHNKHNDTTV